MGAALGAGQVGGAGWGSRAWKRGPAAEASGCGPGPVPLPPPAGSLTVWCRSGMPILKTIMLKWASSGTDMERPCRPPAEEARLPGAPLPWPRVPRRPLPGPSGELSDSEPPSGHSLALWRSSSSLEAGLWVIVGPRGDGGRQHHRSLWGGRGGSQARIPPQPLEGHRHTPRPCGPGQRPHTARGRREAVWTHPRTLLPSGAHTPIPATLPAHVSFPALGPARSPRPSCAPLCR